MQFLAKLNPKATRRSVVRRAVLSCIIAASLWGLAVVFRFNPKFQPRWWAFALLIVCPALVGAACEWQVAPESDDEPAARDKGA
jgi:hypothetical protein